MKKRSSRRDVLKRGLAAAAGTALAGCAASPGHDPFDSRDKPPVPGSNKVPDAEEKHVNTTCLQCAAGCGITVRVFEGRAVKIDGNRDDPLNRGGIGPKGQSGLQVLYHPDRVVGPLRREGGRGSGRLVRVKWDEAIAEIGARLAKLRDAGEARSVVVVDGAPRGLTHELLDRFLAAFGSPNLVDHRSANEGGKVLAMKYMQGVAELPAYDWERTRYVLGMGADLLEGFCQTIHLMRASSRLRVAAVPGRRVKFVYASPRGSVSAAKADEWLAVSPATCGALALGLGHVLVRDGAYDADFVRDHAFGFEPWKDAQGRSHRGYKDVLAAWTPDRTAEVTSLEAKVVERIAHELWENRPSIVIADGSAGAASNGLGTELAIHALNALLGNLERPGGLVVQRKAPLAPWPALAPDAAAQAGRAAARVDGAGGERFPLALTAVHALPAAILEARPYPVQALFLHYSNPIFAKPTGQKWVEAMAKVPLVVSFSPLLDESALQADFVLPDHTYLERYEVVEPAPALGTAVLGFSQPVVTPLHDTRHSGDVIVQLARAVGGPVAAAFPWKDYRAAAQARLAGLEAAGAKLSDAQKRGFWAAEKLEYEQWGEAFRTPSGKVELYSQAIAEKLDAIFAGGALAEAARQRGVAAGSPDDLALPGFETARWCGDPAEFPFALVPYRSMNYAEGGVRHVPWLAELPIVRGNPYRERIELHPGDATRLGVVEGAAVEVETLAGKRRLYAQLHPGVRPGTAGLPLGHGEWPPATGEPTGAYGLLADDSEPFAGLLARQCTRARIRRA